MENNSNGKGVRKGAWTSEEDILLTDCIHKFGEGKWHLVPLRAGLNRCRKSCRLRWLNYLRPDLKRGYFAKDEVDLLVRLHKLLGNRWSLIAGRLPGRTANDVKNFWNTHINPKLKSATSTTSTTAIPRITHANILRPRPRTFSDLQPLPLPPPATACSNSSIKHHDTAANTQPPASSSSAPVNDEINTPDLDECIRWWGDLQMTENQQTPFPILDYDLPTTDSTLPQLGIRDHWINPHDWCHTFSLGADDSQLGHYLSPADKYNDCAPRNM